MPNRKTKSNVERLADEEYSAAAVCAVFGCTNQWLRTLVDGGFIPKGKKHGYYPLGASVQGYIKYLREKKPRKDASERSQLVLAQRAKIQIELTRQLGELLPAALVEESDRELHNAYIQQLEALPPRCANELASIDTAAAIKERLAAEIELIRKAVSVALESRAEILKTGREVSFSLETDEEEQSVAVGGDAPELSAGERGAGAVPGGSDALLQANSRSVRGAAVPKNRRGNGHSDG